MRLGRGEEIGDVRSEGGGGVDIFGVEKFGWNVTRLGRDGETRL